MQSISTEYLNKANKTNEKRDKIYTCILKLEKKLCISNEEKEQTVFFL